MAAMARISFDKPALSLDEQIDLLVSRGLVVSCRETVKRYLQFIGYYRLAGYWFPFQEEESSVSTGSKGHIFKSGTTFEEILEHYSFDRKLRVLLIDAIERIEVAFRATLSNAMCLNHGPHWYLDESLFLVDAYFSHEFFLEKVDRHIKENRKLPFIQHYSNKYNHPPHPPSWMVIEILPIGSISFIYQKLRNEADRKQIARTFGVNPRILSSWIHALAYLRNLCAHHSRVWNKAFTISPEIVKEHSSFLKHNNRFYAQAVVINTFLKLISPDSQWSVRLKELLDEHPSIPLRSMGFPDDWHQERFWQITIE
jgi:abortive infection bacteriophage resistance protein